MARYYALSVECDLFGVVLARRWGRIGSNGRAVFIPFEGIDAARAAMIDIAKVKCRRGYVVITGAGEASGNQAAFSKR
nr:WGR domain-containing protein [Rhizobium setariae]